MQSNIHFFVVTFSLLFCCSNAFNITSLLGHYPDFSTFNDYLSQTELAGTINSRQAITVLVVSNDAISPLSGKSPDVLKKILSVHVVLDYYDVKKLQNLPNKTESLTTLFQASGHAVGQQGFLNATDVSTGNVVIGSAVKGATGGADVVKSIVAQPYNISVLQISTVIIPFGADNPPSNSTSNSTSPALSPAPATNSTSNSTAPALSPLPATNSTSNSTSPSMPPTPATNTTSNSTSPTPMPVPVPVPAPARAPRKALSPSPTPSNANAPGLSPTPANAPGSPPKPAADVPAATDAPTAGKTSEGTAPRFGLLGPITIILCTYVSIGRMI